MKITKHKTCVTLEKNKKFNKTTQNYESSFFLMLILTQEKKKEREREG